MAFLKPVFEVKPNISGFVNLQPNEITGFECRTQNAFPEAHFIWSVPGYANPYPHEEVVECSTGNQVVCTTTSRIKFQASQSR
jgi:hypothetical protein